MGIRRGAFESERIENYGKPRDKIAAQVSSISPSAGLRWAAKAKRIEAKYAGAEFKFLAAANQGAVNAGKATLEVWEACAGAASGLEAEEAACKGALEDYQADVERGFDANGNPVVFDPKKYASLKDAADRATMNRNSTFNFLFRAATGKNAFGSSTHATTESDALKGFVGDNQTQGWGSETAIKSWFDAQRKKNAELAIANSIPNEISDAEIADENAAIQDSSHYDDDDDDDLMHLKGAL